jgi:hypothetical protein
MWPARAEGILPLAWVEKELVGTHLGRRQGQCWAKKDILILENNLQTDYQGKTQAEDFAKQEAYTQEPGLGAVSLDFGQHKPLVRAGQSVEAERELFPEQILAAPFSDTITEVG